jgi:pSer/pThr/pTyr-binding forkhead associated (FHA) protein
MPANTVTCTHGHIHDSAWTRCPYCEASGSGPSSSQTALQVPAWLQVVNGKNQAKRYPIRQGKTHLGADPSCDIVLDHDYVSGRHACIEAMDADGAWSFELTDLDSTNGTFLNDASEGLTRAPLTNEDHVLLGALELIFRTQEDRAS